MKLDDPVSKWLPALPDANRVTLRMLANMTSGYSDYATDPGFQKDFYANPFRQFTRQELLSIGLSRPRFFDPGTAWGYAHTNIVILGQVLEKVTHQPLQTVLQRMVLDPLHLNQTKGSSTPLIPSPVLHAFTSERRTFVGIPAGRPFLEESTYWNPSWSLAPGSVETTDIADMTTTADAIGNGTLLTSASHHAQVDAKLLGFGRRIAGCSCAPQTNFYNYGLGVVRSGSWLLENPLFAGYPAVEASLPSKGIAIAVAATYTERSFDSEGSASNYAEDLFRTIGARLVPTDPPPVKPSS